MVVALYAHLMLGRNSDPTFLHRPVSRLTLAAPNDRYGVESRYQQRSMHLPPVCYCMEDEQREKEIEEEVELRLANSRER